MARDINALQQYMAGPQVVYKTRDGYTSSEGLPTLRVVAKSAADAERLVRAWARENYPFARQRGAVVNANVSHPIAPSMGRPRGVTVESRFASAVPYPPLGGLSGIGGFVAGMFGAADDAYLQRFVEAYIEAALWSSTDDDGEPLDAKYGLADLAPEAREQMEKDCAKFIQKSKIQTSSAFSWWTAEQAGHDFWLTRNGHGAGFWDRGQGAAGDALTKVAKSFGSSDLYVGDDGQLFVS